MSANVVPLPKSEAQPEEPRRFRFGKQTLTRATAAFADTTGVTLRDTDLRGFVCRKQTSAWMLGVERKVRGKLHRISIAEFTPATKPGTIEAARDKAQAIMAELAAGTYLSPTDRAAMNARERDLVDLTIYSAPTFHGQENPHVRASTIESYGYAVKRMFLADVGMSDITPEMVRDEYRRMLGVTSPASASNALRSVRALWQSWADAHPAGQEPSPNPVSKLTGKRKAVKATPPREGALKPVERPLWWAEAERLAVHLGPTGTLYRALQMLFLTGCRRDEILHLRWAEVGADVITIPAERMKAGVELKRPITPGMRSILDAQRGASDEWVFPAVRGSGPARDPRKALKRIGVGDITPHDLRRTYISTAEVIGVPSVAIKMLVGHSTGDITEAYAKALRPQLPEFAERIETGLLS
ncbi:tyrosine-type recombinase/integrase [Ruegeria sp. HKCCA6837]|uniref:tyrosine-type recombinase/integrase n=1 Tax=Ruegeria sp. HKCCA6837 TaxID=2682989 RepID=UPI001488F7A1|nr:tyrosine-type recombinase/integrase [Ruegeria sp. HKCCA6837]